MTKETLTNKEEFDFSSSFEDIFKNTEVQDLSLELLFNKKDTRDMSNLTPVQINALSIIMTVAVPLKCTLLTSFCENLLKISVSEKAMGRQDVVKIKSAENQINNEESGLMHNVRRLF